MASNPLTAGQFIGLGAVAGVFSAMAAHATDMTLWAALAGAVAGYLVSCWLYPNPPKCGIPRLLGGCGGQTKVKDRSGNSRPRRACWGHPNGPPRRLGARLLGRG